MDQRKQLVEVLGYKIFAERVSRRRGFTKPRALRHSWHLELNRILIIVFGVRVSVRHPSLEEAAKRKAVFRYRQVVNSGLGYFHLDPMPSEEELTAFYKYDYWAERGGKDELRVKARDLAHFDMIKSLVPDSIGIGKTFANFGAGEGGVSHLMWSLGMNIVNIEPSGIEDCYSSRWATVESISELPESSIDFLYGSHSLEHVQSVDDFGVAAQKVLRPGGFMFWEVPNADDPSWASERAVQVPHTYYFSASFFESWFRRTVLVSGFQEHERIGNVDAWRESMDPLGPVIRAVGQI